MSDPHVPWPDTQPGLEQALDSYRGLQREVAALAAEMERVRAARAGKVKEMAELRRAIEGFARVVGLDPAGLLAAQEVRELPSIPDMAYEYMRARGGRARVVEIVQHLEESGKFAPSGRPSGQNYGPVYSALLRDRKRFRQGGRGEFVLLEMDEQPA